MKKIANIVFYKFNGKEKNMVQACLFYNDGTVRNVTYEEALKEAKIIAKEENSTGRDSFNNLLNKKRIFVMSGAELTKKFDSFVVNETVKNAIDEALDNIVLVDNQDKVLVKENNANIKSTKLMPFAYKKFNFKKYFNNNKEVTDNNSIKEDKEVNNNSVEDTKTVIPFIVPVNEVEAKEEKNIEKGTTIPFVAPASSNEDINAKELNNNAEITKNEEVKNNEEPEKVGIFTKAKRFLKGKLVPMAVAA